MNNSDTEQKKEYACDEALRLHEAGSSESMIMEKFPEFKADIREMFEVMNVLASGRAAAPEEKKVKSILEKIPAMDAPIASPYGGMFGRISALQKFGVVALAAVLLIGGAVVGSRARFVSDHVAFQGGEAAISKNDSSDAALEKDVSYMNKQIEGLDADDAAMDQSFNDQPVEQTM